jgi:restriction endonuclease S subunit
MRSGWETSTLGETLAVIRNGVNCKQDKRGNGDMISRIESIADATFDLGKVGFAELRDVEKKRNRLLRGDILFSHINSPAHVGKSAIFDCDAEVYHGVNLLLMRPTESVAPHFLNYWLKSLFWSGYWRRECKQSVNQASVNQKDISRVEISYPTSLEEQKRIVSILDEAFEGIATAKVIAEQNLRNARALFESYVSAVFIKRRDSCEHPSALVKTGLFRSLDEVCNVEYGTRVVRKRDGGQGFPVYGGGGATFEMDRFNREDRLLVARFGMSEKCTRFVAGQFFLNDSGLTVSPKNGELLQRYLDWQLLSLNNEIYALGKGTAQKNLDVTEFRALSIYVPSSLAEQHRIVRRLDELDFETLSLARIFERKLVALVELRTSLLHQAFNGYL